MDVFGILLEQLGFVAAILLLLLLVSIVARRLPSSAVGFSQAINDRHSSKRKA